MTESERLMKVTEKHGAKHYKPLPVVLSQGQGCWVSDVEGRRYLDMMSAYSALNQGHRHPQILEAMQAQLQSLTLTSRAFHNDQLGPLLQELTSVCGMDKALMMNTGAEAVETAVKLARKWGYRVKQVPRYEAEILVCRNNFHGRTTSVISFSTEQHYKNDFGPFTPGFRDIPFGDVEALEAAITPNTVGFLVEPIQGEGGIIVPPEGYLREVRALCDKHNVLLMADEIQVGLGRTGKMFCCQHDEIEPDILILGKALGGGFYPVSCIATKAHLLGLFEKGEHGSTFGGNPLGAAVARASLRVLCDQNLAGQAEEMGNYFMERLRALNSPYVRDVRGRGLLIGVEIDAPQAARPFCMALLERGVLCKETHETVIRFAPPLIITREQIDWAMERISEVLLDEQREAA